MREPRIDPSFRFAYRVYRMEHAVSRMTFVETLCYVIGFILMACALGVVMLELPSPFGRALGVFVAGYLIARLGDWAAE